MPVQNCIQSAGYVGVELGTNAGPECLQGKNLQIYKEFHKLRFRVTGWDYPVAITAWPLYRARHAGSAEAKLMPVCSWSWRGSVQKSVATFAFPQSSARIVPVIS